MTATEVARILPSVPRLMNTCRSMAVLEAILCPSPERRRYFFSACGRPGLEVAVMDNGSGDDYSIAFDSAIGVVITGFDHESPMSPYLNGEPWPGLLESVPNSLRGVLDESMNCDEDGMPSITVCMWRENGDDAWRLGDISYPSARSDPDGATMLFRLLIADSPEAFRYYAEEQYGVAVELSAVRHVFDLDPLTDDVVSLLNSSVRLDDLKPEIEGMGYEVALTS